jgi:hypothetical protein
VVKNVARLKEPGAGGWAGSAPGEALLHAIAVLVVARLTNEERDALAKGLDASVGPQQVYSNHTAASAKLVTEVQWARPMMAED